MKFSLQANCVQNAAAQYAYTFELYSMSSCVYRYAHTHTYRIYIYMGFHTYVYRLLKVT